MHMLVAILSDTHSSHATIAKALALVEQRGAGLILHCGDIEDAETIALFPAHTQFVFGNCDHDRAGIDEAVRKLGATLHPSWGHVEIAGKHIGFVHGDDATLLHDLIQSQALDYLFHGHTHVIRDERRGKTRIINPGALYRARVKTFALLQPGKDDIAWIEVA